MHLYWQNPDVYCTRPCPSSLAGPALRLVLPSKTQVPVPAAIPRGRSPMPVLQPLCLPLTSSYCIQEWSGSGQEAPPYLLYSREEGASCMLMLQLFCLLCTVYNMMWQRPRSNTALAATLRGRSPMLLLQPHPCTRQKSTLWYLPCMQLGPTYCLQIGCWQVVQLEVAPCMLQLQFLPCIRPWCGGAVQQGPTCCIQVGDQQLAQLEITCKLQSQKEEASCLCSNPNVSPVG